MPPQKKMPDVPFQKPVAGQNPIFIDTPLYAHRKTDSTSFTASTPKNALHTPLPPLPLKTMSAEKRKRCPHTRKTSLSRCHPTVSTPKKRSPRTPYRPYRKKTMSAEKRKRCPHTRKTSLSRCHSTVSTPKKNDLHFPPQSTKCPAAKILHPQKKYAPAANAAGA